MRWLAWTLAGLAAGPAALVLYVRRQGDADVRVDARAVTIVETKRSPGRWQVRCRLPVTNRGRQKGMLYEILVRPEFPGRWAAPARWSVAFFWPGVQETGYWSATLLKPGQVVPLEIELTAYGPEAVVDRLARLDRLGLVVRHGVIGRTPLRWYLTEVHLPLAAATAVKGPEAPRAGSPAGPASPAGLQRPVLTVKGRVSAPSRQPGSRGGPRRQGAGGGGHPASPSAARPAASGRGHRTLRPVPPDASGAAPRPALRTVAPAGAGGNGVSCDRVASGPVSSGRVASGWGRG